MTNTPDSPTPALEALDIEPALKGVLRNLLSAHGVGGYQVPVNGPAERRAVETILAIVAQLHHPTASVEAVALQVENANLRTTIETAAMWFENYARQHLAKTPPDTVKAETNAACAETLRNALTAQQHPGLGSGGPTASDEQQVRGSPQERPSEAVTALVAEAEKAVSFWRVMGDSKSPGFRMMERLLAAVIAGEQTDSHSIRACRALCAFMESEVPEGSTLRIDGEMVDHTLLNEAQHQASDALASVATEATGVVPATTPSAPVPTEDHEQGVRGSEERAGGEG